MRILVTNDDGIRAEGIRILAEVARKFGDVTVMAPLNQSSAMSHHITLRDSMELHNITDFPVEGIKAYALDGTPADCVRSSFLGLIDAHDLPDLVLSGVNKGANCGFDIQYSATVGAAMEALLYDVQAICFSQNFFPDDKDYHEDVLHKNIESILADLIQKPLPRGQAWNVNFPSCSMADYKGILENRVPAQKAFWDDKYVLRDTNDGRQEVVLDTVPTVDAEPGSDIKAVIDGYISIGTIRNTVLL